jgi:hypothetical protein
MVRWKRDNVLLSDYIQSKSRDQRYIALADKLYLMTGISELSASMPSDERVAAIRNVHGQICIDRVHGMNAIPNTSGLTLSVQELEMIEEVFEEVSNLSFCSSCNSVSEDRGIKTAGMINNEIGRLLSDVAEGSRIKTFQSFSCHDTTIHAITASMGLRLDEPPDFTSYILYELYSMPGGQAIVKVYYNPNPCLYGHASLSAKYWPASPVYQRWNDLKDGYFTLDEFISRFTHSEYREIELAIRRMARASLDPIFASPGICTPDHLLMFSHDHIRVRYEECFNYYDRDRTGKIDNVSIKEMLVRFEELDLDDDRIEHIISHFDREHKGYLELDQFLCMMALIRSQANQV